MIEANLEKYSLASTKIEKSLIVSGIVDAVRESSPDGGFVKEERGLWYEVGDHIAREKCGQRCVGRLIHHGHVVGVVCTTFHRFATFAGCVANRFSND